MGPSLAAQPVVPALAHALLPFFGNCLCLPDERNALAGIRIGTGRTKVSPETPSSKSNEGFMTSSAADNGVQYETCSTIEPRSYSSIKWWSREVSDP